jgi:hypothetical protein
MNQKKISNIYIRVQDGNKLLTKQENEIKKQKNKKTNIINATITIILDRIRRLLNSKETDIIISIRNKDNLTKGKKKKKKRRKRGD